MGSETLEHFVTEARPRLWRAFVGARGLDGADEAVSEALMWASENEERLLAMANPLGYLYRVGMTRSTPRSEPPKLPPPADVHLPDLEPELIAALLRLPGRQRTAVWLVHGCGWSYEDVADVLGIGTSTVGTHVARGLTTLRQHLEATSHA